MMGFSVLDWLILLVVLLNVAGAIAQGFLYELFSFVGVIVGYLIAAWEYPRVAAFYSHYVNSAWAADIAGFLTVFFVVLLLGSVAGKIGRRAVEGIGLRWIDHFLGGLFGFLEGRYGVHCRGDGVGRVSVPRVRGFMIRGLRLSCWSPGAR